MTDETTKFEDAESYSPNFMKDKSGLFFSELK